jgi:hypothetical protein
MRKDGRTDTTKLMVAFQNFPKAPKKSLKQLFQAHTLNVLQSGSSQTAFICYTEHGTKTPAPSVQP